MNSKKLSHTAVILVVLILSSLACNLPMQASATPAPAVAATRAFTATLPVTSPTPALPSRSPTAAIATQPPVKNTVTPLPAATEIRTHLPTVTLPGGTGFLFATQKISKDDRDVWWNASQFVPNTNYRMIELGVIDSPASIRELAFPAKTATVFEIKTGLAFGIEIQRGGKLSYAVFRVIKRSAEGAVTFDWVYPFAGRVVGK